MAQTRIGVNTFSLHAADFFVSVPFMMKTAFPSIEEVERRRQAKGVSILELCKNAKIAPWSYHRMLNGQIKSPRIRTLKQLYSAVAEMKSHKRGASRVPPKFS